MERSISAEWLKLRHTRIGLVLAVLPILSLLTGGANYYFNQGVLQNGWYSLWTQVSLFYGEFFLPILIAICCAYVCRLENLNRNWHMVMTSPVSAASVFIAKLFVVSILILFAQALFMGLYLIAGILFSLPGPFPIETLGWIIRGWYASLSIIAFQLCLSLRIRSFATPIGISLLAVFIGLGMYIAKLGLLFPFSLLTIGMSVLSQDKLTGLQNIQFWAMNMAFVVIFASIFIHRLKNKDIVSS
ncbi:multidrug ABC transporter permease [Niallia circulans]|uniref:Multidrug ABC transporter permease n=2 Tax=Bacillaceae TaxID=186817 RepID=A0A0J1ILW9_NIACI|nr:ABC transporter permease [Niallia circulans]KLV26956.1 multidrug ABC transporter permease [Niallia circulans]MDR4318023.1 multidrug ABC transporter permease [Niallia circulans]MED3839094.1 ABC transporter permease [Niallia circulans]MED4242209.1 ABC transporter permease [Niallia circulans]MED4250683.1 ABC transporter permease [Niallia circulans]